MIVPDSKVNKDTGLNLNPSQIITKGRGKAYNSKPIVPLQNKIKNGIPTIFPVFLWTMDNGQRRGMSK